MDSELQENIPGYEAVLKSVLKKQIQMLIEQLRKTGEEAILLTASLKDGTFTNLGSNYGQDFLAANTDLKAKFYGFCKHKKDATKTDHSEKVTSAKSTPKTPRVSTDVPVVRLRPGIQDQSVTHEIAMSVDKGNTSTPQSVASLVQTKPRPLIKIVQKDAEPLYLAQVIETDEEPSVVQFYEEEIDEKIEHIQVAVSPTPEHKVSIEPMPMTSVQTSTPRTKTKRPFRSRAAFPDHHTQIVGKTGVLSEYMLGKLKKCKFECEECGKLFIRQDQYNDHIRCHTGEKPFSCRYCGQVFQLKVAMQKHEAKQHPDKQLVNITT